MNEKPCCQKAREDERKKCPPVRLVDDWNVCNKSHDELEKEARQSERAKMRKAIDELEKKIHSKEEADKHSGYYGIWWNDLQDFKQKIGLITNSERSEDVRISSQNGSEKDDTPNPEGISKLSVENGNVTPSCGPTSGRNHIKKYRGNGNRPSEKPMIDMVEMSPDTAEFLIKKACKTDDEKPKGD